MPAQIKRKDHIVRLAVSQNDIAGFNRDFGTCPNSDANIGRRQGRGIVNAIADKADAVSLLL